MEQVNDRRRTAVAQALAFTLHTLVAAPPPQSWHDATSWRFGMSSVVARHKKEKTTSEG